MFREMRRKRQQLSQEECERILREQWRGVLSVAGDDGYPYGVPIDFAYDDGRILFHCARAGHKLDAMQACDKVCLTVVGDAVPEPGEWWSWFDSVVVFGRVHMVEDEAERLAGLRAFGAKFYPTDELLEAEMVKSAGRCHLMCIEVEHMTGKHVKEE